MTPEELKQEITAFKNSTQKQVDALKLEVSNLKKKRVIDRYLDNESKTIIGNTVSDNILDIVWNDYFYYQTYFESLDGWNLIDTGTSSVSRLGVHLQTGSVANDITSIDKEPVYQNVLSFDEESRFATSIFVTTTTEIEAFVGIGFVNNGVTGVHYGFFVDDSTLFGTCANGTTQTTQSLMTISTNHPTTTDPIYYVEARFYPGTKIDFLVAENGGDLIPRGTITTNLPSGDMFEWLSAQAKATTTTSVELRLGNMEYIQHRPKR